MKKIMILFSAFIFAVIGMTNVKAVNFSDAQSANTYYEVTGTDSNGTVKLLQSVIATFEIENGQNYTLDLNGKTLQNTCHGTNDFGCNNGHTVAIWVKNGGTLTIIDSQNGGKVSLQSGTTGVALILNEGTLTIDGGTFENIEDTVNVHSIENQGTLTINGGTFKSNNSGGAAIHNNSGKTLTFNDGSVETNVTGAWGISNEGTATISDGTFTQNHDFSVIMNHGDLDISGGEFKSSGNGGHNALISTVNSGNTTVTDGNFDAGTNGLVFYAGGGSSSTTVGKTSVVGGHFSNNSSVESLLENTIYTINSNGDVVLREADYSGLEGAISVAKGLDTSKYTATSVKALLEAIEDAENVEKGLKANEQYKIDNLTKALTTAIANLKEEEDAAVKPGSDNTDNSDEKAPNTFDSGLVYMGLALSAVGASVVSIKKLRKN